VIIIGFISEYLAKLQDDCLSAVSRLLEPHVVEGMINKALDLDPDVAANLALSAHIIGDYNFVPNRDKTGKVIRYSHGF